MNDAGFMKKALAQARVAKKHNEVPIGAVVVKDGKIISRACNMRETKKNALMHAEIIAIDRACRKLGGWRLDGCEMYVTLEPCPMCMGAIIQSRISRVVFGSCDEKAGFAGSVEDVSKALPHKVEVVGGVLEEETTAIIKEFFAELRALKKSQKEKVDKCGENES